MMLIVIKRIYKNWEETNNHTLQRFIGQHWKIRLEIQGGKVKEFYGES